MFCSAQNYNFQCFISTVGNLVIWCITANS